MFFRRTKPERRQYERFDADSLLVNCLPVGNEQADKPWPAYARDISTSGISLLIQRRFECGTCLSLEIADPGENGGRRFVARVVRVRLIRDGAWDLGCAFDSHLDADTVGLFRVQRSDPPEPSHRAWYRFPSPYWTTCYVLEGQEESILKNVRVVNVSPVGIGLLVSRDVGEGTTLTIQVPSGKGSQHRALARVIHSIAQPRSQVLLGCVFLAELSDQEFHAFLE